MRSLRCCTIFAAGTYYGDTAHYVPQDTLVIAADGGYDHAHNLGITVDTLVGDFDSIVHNDPHGVPITHLPSEKDDPDLLSALKIGWSQGAREFHIFGGLGGRIDHTIANMQLLTQLSACGGVGFLYGDGQIVTALTNAQADFNPSNTQRSDAVARMVSVFSHSQHSYDVNEIGLKYALQHATLTNTCVQGVSNEFVGNTPAHIDVHDGTLLITFPIETPLPTITWFSPIDGDLGALDTSVSHALNTDLLRAQAHR